MSLMLEFDLSQRWMRFVPEKVGAGTFRRVLEPRYTEEHRKYHNLKHIASCLEMFDEHVFKRTLHRPSIELAIWFHDVVYDPRSKTNEEDSADVMVEEAKKNRFSIDTIDRARRMILATKDHVLMPLMTQEIGWFLDIDLSILGTKDKVFDDYERAIREEYSWVSEDAYAKTRIGILKGLLGRDWIFSTNEFQRYYEGYARKNIKRSIQSLEKAA